MMIRRPRCRSCHGRIWPWQDSIGRGAMGVKDNDRERSFMKHMECMRTENAARRALRDARVQRFIDRAEEGGQS
jgi:hypothetical protein